MYQFSTSVGLIDLKIVLLEFLKYHFCDDRVLPSALMPFSLFGIKDNDETFFHSYMTFAENLGYSIFRLLNCSENY